MTDLHKAAQQALEALGRATGYDDAHFDAITALREALAKPADSGCAFPMCHNKDYQEAVAAQVMAELYTGIVVPPGYALVPVEPTPEMCRAYTGGAITEAGFKWCRHQWAAMLAAAPQPKDKP